MSVLHAKINVCTGYKFCYLCGSILKNKENSLKVVLKKFIKKTVTTSPNVQKATNGRCVDLVIKTVTKRLKKRTKIASKKWTSFISVILISKFPLGLFYMEYLTNAFYWGECPLHNSLSIRYENTKLGVRVGAYQNIFEKLVLFFGFKLTTSSL